MSILREHGTAYLEMRRSLGYKLDGHGRLLMKFIGYLEEHAYGTVTTEAALAWAAAPDGVTQSYRSRRLSVARCFARYLSAFDPACQVPPPGLTGPPQPRPVPYLYSPEDRAAPTRAAAWQARGGPPPLLVAPAGGKGRGRGGGTAGTGRNGGPRGPLHGERGRAGCSPRPRDGGAFQGLSGAAAAGCPLPRSPAFFLSEAGARLTGRRSDGVFAELVALPGISGRPRVYRVCVFLRAPPPPGVAPAGRAGADVVRVRAP